MKFTARLAVALLLLFNGAGAVYGGLSLIMYPDGSAIHLSRNLLEYSFFDSYLIPGIVLLLSNGFLSLYVFVAVLLSYKKYWRLVVLQGTVLIAWLILQIAMIHVIHYFHLVMAIVGLILIIAGFLSDRPPAGDTKNELRDSR